MSSISKHLIIYLLIFLLFNQKNISYPFKNEIPLVSIIIPVHNFFNYTYNCIYSILNDKTTIPYEIIIANDISTDDTKLLTKKYFTNITNIYILNNKKKYNFVMNCNKAVKFSRGKYILFLNSDTEVHKEWLTFLFRLIEKDDTIGMVGSKLIYPSGQLQEAGGIVWNDGDPDNFGKWNKADLPEYNYVKEVDYISGASIIIRKSIWEKIGGFDENFSPAYYEDTDFAFKLRKFGYKVMYQPKSVVMHHRGISNGKNITSGIKRYLIINRKKFIAKWKNELKWQPLKGNDTFNARDRGYNKNRILVIDNYVPNFDKNFINRFSLLCLDIFQDIGLLITFLGDEYQILEPYTTNLQQKGIEVLYGDEYKYDKFEEWLKENIKYYKYILKNTLKLDIFSKHLYYNKIS